MEKSQSYIAHLLLKSKSQELTIAESATLENWKQASGASEQELHDLMNFAQLQQHMKLYEEAQLRAADMAFPLPTATISNNSFKTPNLRLWWAVAAMLIVVATSIGIFLIPSKNTQHDQNNVQKATEILAGKEGAILTLADGKQIVLDSLNNGVVAAENGIDIVLQDGQLAYSPKGTIAGETVYNTITTPKGRQFSLLLPDGSQVWLNAASSIRYPMQFTEKDRIVSLTGEAYFDISKNKKAPFKVIVQNEIEIEVLGTQFNVNAYNDEQHINTTLLDGVVRVHNLSSRARMSSSSSALADNYAILKPGQQAKVSKINPDRSTTTPSINVVSNIDTENVIAWKNGYFKFENTTLQEIMRQLQRWYNIEVIYGEKIPVIPIMGEMTRDVPLAGLLKNLGKMGLQYRLEGRHLYILPE